MRMHLDGAGIDHQPFKIRFGYQGFEQSFPHSPVASPAKAPMGILPVAIIWRQIPPRRSCAHNPKDGIDELPVVSRFTSPCSFPSKQTWFQQFSRMIGQVMAAMGGNSHLNSCMIEMLLLSQICPTRDDTP